LQLLAVKLEVLPRALASNANFLNRERVIFKNRRGLFAWCIFDWGNSAFPTIVTTFIFSAYFTEKIASDEVIGTTQWGYAISISALAVAIFSPIAGATADHIGRQRLWLLFFLFFCIVGSASLWFSEPTNNFVFYTLLVVAIANFCFELSMVFYNAMLPDLVHPYRIGRWSGIGWGLGYAGGLCCLIIALIFLIDKDFSIFSLSRQSFEHLRATGPLVAIWMIVFCTPLFFCTNDQPKQPVKFHLGVYRGLLTFFDTIRLWKRQKNIFSFLLARMIYIDGLNTLFAFGGIFAAGTFGFTFEELIILGISMNIGAGIGSIVFSFIEERIGPRNLIQSCLFCLIIFGVAALITEDKMFFWIILLGMGLFVGPVQSASRSLMARLTPINARTEMFGLYAFSGKATAFLGPAILSWVTAMFSSQRAGMATIFIFMGVGLCALRFVKEPAIEDIIVRQG